VRIVGSQLFGPSGSRLPRTASLGQIRPLRRLVRPLGRRYAERRDESVFYEPAQFDAAPGVARLMDAPAPSPGTKLQNLSGGWIRSGRRDLRPSAKST
jgi:hypothetical protein